MLEEALLGFVHSFGLGADVPDPESARFEWPYALVAGTSGDYTCGRVNSRNRMGGYSGAAYVIVGVKNGTVSYIQLSDGDRDQTFINCSNGIRKGEFVPR